MDSQVDRLVQQTWAKFQECDDSQRLLIAISGIPGSGKTTLAATVAAGLNKTHHASQHERFPNSPTTANASQPDIAFVIPLDGYHLTRKQLSELPNAEEAISRRGAAFTFDATSYLDLVTQVRKPIMPETSTIYAPSFDHAIKDPRERDIAIPSTARIVLFEGLYTALDREGWRDAHALMDEVWFVTVDVDTATERVAKRNFAAGITATFEESVSRTTASDMRNGRDVLERRLRVDEEIESVPDATWRSEEVKKVDDELGDVDEESFRKQRMLRMDSIAMLAADGVGM